MALGASMTRSEHDQGWEYHLARILRGEAGTFGHDVDFRDLTSPGTTTDSCFLEQLAFAISAHADLVSVTIGYFDAEGVMHQRNDKRDTPLIRALDAAHANGSTILLTNHPFRPEWSITDEQRQRVAEFNAELWILAREHHALILDLWGMRELRDPLMWNPGDTMLSSQGCRLVARHAAHTLGLAYAESA